MSTPNKYVAVADYSEIFRQPMPVDTLSFVRKYPTELLLVKLSRINAILFQQPDMSKQTLAGLETLFPGMDVSLILQIRDLETSTYFSSPSISLLVKSCLENFVETSSDDRRADISTLGLDLFKTILIYNKRYYGFDSAIKPDSFEGIFRLDIQQQAYMRSNAYQKMFTMIKFAFVAKFLSSTVDFKQECKEFCAYYKVGNPWIFGKFFMDIYATILPKDQEGKYALNLLGLSSPLVSEFTIDKENLKGKGPLSIHLDMVPKPFYRIGSDAIIIDYNFFHYAIDQGFFYLFFLRSSLSEKKRFNSYNAYQGHIGYHFFEQYLTREHLSKIFFRNHQKIVSSQRYGDFIIKPSENKVLVIEVKNTTVNARTLEEMDFDAFRSVIDQNFTATKAPGAKGKGLAQIRQQMDYLCGEDTDLRQQLRIGKAEKMTVYPIIIYYDSTFDISGVNNYVNEHFLTVTADFQKQFRSVKPVTLLNINILTMYFALLKNKPNQLTDLIDEYHLYLNKNRKRYQKERHPHDHYISNRSFDSYLRGKLKGDHFATNLPAMKRDFDLNIEALK